MWTAMNLVHKSFIIPACHKFDRNFSRYFFILRSETAAHETIVRVHASILGMISYNYIYCEIHC